ncbi:dienelactone hydrolase family protein, partial [Serratia marcescens]|nr:dienelactone hydrolase family protein [Serratia marcescens]
MKTEHVMTLEQAQGGFAPAAAPLAASAIITDEQGIHAGQTTIPSQGDALPAYVAKPADQSGPFPIVLVVQEIFGVHEHIQDLCRRLAKQGYLAIAPELYFRQGDANDYTDI